MMPGDRLGQYAVLAKLGEGGMGEVYRARGTLLKRDVALKVLPANVAPDAEREARVDREAQALAALNHPHIAQVYGVVHDAGVRAIVMELVEGQTLAERIALRPVAKVLTFLGIHHLVGTNGELLVRLEVAQVGFGPTCPLRRPRLLRPLRIPVPPLRRHAILAPPSPPPATPTVYAAASQRTRRTCVARPGCDPSAAPTALLH